MLKIKDNVDLKELEKFGFEYRVNNYKEQWVITRPAKVKPYSSWHKDCRLNLSIISVYKIDRLLTHSSHKDVDSILFDLIKADLVEKVEEW